MAKNNKKRKQNNQPRPTQSFQNLVAQTATKMLHKDIDQRIMVMGRQLAANQSRELAEILTRISAMERILIENNLTTLDNLVETIATIEDEALGLVKIEAGEAEVGDKLRLTLSSKESEKEEYGETSQITVNNLNGEQLTLPKELEEALVGARAGELVKTSFTSRDKTIDVKMVIDRISRDITEKEVSSEA